jgi:quercetin dioxygenase-like cupin family protein
MTLKATSEQTGGSIGFLEATGPPGYGPPRHIHHSHDELFYVLEGEFLFLVGQRQVNAPPGTFVFIPRGTVHAAKGIGTEPCKVLIAYVPGAWSTPSRNSLRHAPSKEKMRIGARARAGPWRR